MIKVFISYSHVDVQFKEQLEKHLAALRRNGEIEPWTDTMISPSEVWSESISKALNEADLIICLISSDFINSDYCYDIEFKDALKRHAENKARVIPIIIRSCDWNDTPFAHLQVLPSQGRPIKEWYDQDQAFLNVVEGLKKAIKLLTPAPVITDVPIAISVQQNKAQDSLGNSKKNSGNVGFAQRSMKRGKMPGKKIAYVVVLLIIVFGVIYMLKGNKADDVIVKTDEVVAKTNEVVAKGQSVADFLEHHSSQDLLIICLIGAVAGWIAGAIVSSESSFLLDILIGIVAYMGYLVYEKNIHLTGNEWADKTITATAVATVVALVVKVIRGVARR